VRLNAKGLKQHKQEICKVAYFYTMESLRSIDLTINGGINLTGLESLQKVEDLEE
jgi:hypothetical protein